MSSLIVTVALIAFFIALFSLRIAPPVGAIMPVVGMLAGAALIWAGIDLFAGWDDTARRFASAASQAGAPRELIPGQHAGASGMLHAAPIILILVGALGLIGFGRRLVTLVRGY